MYDSLDITLDAFAARRVQKLTQCVTWISNRLGLSEPPIPLGEAQVQAFLTNEATSPS